MATAAIEWFILLSRYLLVPLYCALMFEIVKIIGHFWGVLTGGGSADLIENILQFLELLDVTMIANLIWLISAGSYYVFVHPYPDLHERRKPRSLAHISTGILKEKMAGSIVGVSSVYLLQVFLNLSTSKEPVDVARMGAMIAIHLVFIGGLIAFNHANKADHLTHPEPPNATKPPVEAHH